MQKSIFCLFIPVQSTTISYHFLSLRNLYIDFIDYENPDLIICETTERFIIVPTKILKSDSGEGEIYTTNINKEIVKQIMNFKYNNNDLYLLYLNKYKSILAKQTTPCP